MFDAKSLLNMVMGAGQQMMQKGQGGSPGGSSGSSLGGLGGLMGSVLGGQSPGGGLPAPQQGGPSAGSAGLQDVVSQARQAIQSGNYAGFAEQAKALLQNNAGGLMAGGLAGLAIGTKTGRSIATKAAMLGGLALVGGLAYKALQNYKQGKPLTQIGDPVGAAPAGSGFAESDRNDQERALIMVRAMIAAAAADGEIDQTEHQRILGNLRQAGLDDEAAAFIDQEMASPLDAAALARLATTPELAAEIYTAARLAIDPDLAAERIFLRNLAAGMNLDPDLAAHIDAAALSVMQPAA